MAHKTAELAKLRVKKRLTPRERIAVNVRRCQPDKHPGGRPTQLKPEFCKAVVDFMARGYSLTAFAGSIGVARDTVYAWGEENKEFSDALKKARAARTLYWEKRLEIAGPDARAVIFALRNSCSDEWKQNPDENSVNVNVTNETNINTSKPVEDWTRDEIQAYLEKTDGLPEKGRK